MPNKLDHIYIIKAGGEKVLFSLDKLRNSLYRTGADESTVNYVLKVVTDELYDGIGTKEIYNRAFALLKKKHRHYASKYKLKKAIYELGPTGFPFERFVGAILKYAGYKVEVGLTIKGHCVSHEVDVIADKGGKRTLIECKFHSLKGTACNVKVPLYINARFQDIKANWKEINGDEIEQTPGWVVTNTRFTKDAETYGRCSGLYLLSWDYPKGDALKDRIDRLRLYPITVSTLLTAREKDFLLERDIVLCRQLLENLFFLDHLGLSANRKTRVIKEINQICKRD